MLVGVNAHAIVTDSFSEGWVTEHSITREDLGGGRVKLTTISPVYPWGALSKTLAVEDIEATPNILVCVEALSNASWSIKIDWTNPHDLENYAGVVEIAGGSAASGEIIVDLKSKLPVNLQTGAVDVKVLLYVVGSPGAYGIFRNVSLVESAYIPGTILSYSEKNWVKAGAEAAAYDLHGMSVTALSDGGSVEKTATVDLGIYPAIKVVTSSGAAPSWSMECTVDGTTYPLKPMGDDRGDFIFNLDEISGISGTAVVKFKLVLENAGDILRLKEIKFTVKEEPSPYKAHVEALTLKKLDGSVIDTIPENITLKAEVQIKSIASVTNTLYTVLALYNSSGSIVAVSTCKSEIGAYMKDSAAAYFDVPKAKGNYLVKAFVTDTSRGRVSTIVESEAIIWDLKKQGVGNSYNVDYVEGIADSSVSVALKSDSPEYFGAASIVIPVDFSKNPVFEMDAENISGFWGIKINDGTLDIDIRFTENDLAESGSYSFDLGEITGFTGKKTITLSFFVIEYGSHTIFKNLAIRKGEIPL